MKKKKVARKVTWQKHHITYEPEVIVKVRRMAHYYITCLQRFKGFTADEKAALVYAIVNKPTLTEDTL